MSNSNDPGLSIQCRCGEIHLVARGAPILAATCYCDSCQAAAAELSRLGSEQVAEPDGGTGFVLYRKDRVDFSSVSERLVEHRLTAESPTRRVLSACCSSPLFLEFQRGHWVSVYARRVAENERPRATVRTMTKYAPPGTTFDDGVPSPSTHNVGFMARLLWAWVSMGFRSPTIAVSGGVSARLQGYRATCGTLPRAPASTRGSLD